MKFVLMIYQGRSPLPGSDSWKALAARVPAARPPADRGYRWNNETG
jgi:hypothetical protein